MCGGGPEPPKKSKAEKAAEREAMLQRRQALQEQNQIRAENKKVRFEQLIRSLSAGYGRKSLLSGGGGGAGFAAPAARSLLEG